jgi:hypothetical protein
MDRLNKAGNMIGANRRFLITRSRQTSGDEYRLSCDLSVFLDFLSKT